MHDNRHPLEGLRDLARLGVEVAYITALGDDPFSDDMLTGWRREGVSTAYVLRLPPGLYLFRRVTRGHAGAMAPEPWPIHANPLPASRLVRQMFHELGSKSTRRQAPPKSPAIRPLRIPWRPQHEALPDRDLFGRPIVLHLAPGRSARTGANTANVGR